MSLKGFFNSEQKNIKIAALIMMITVFLSRFLGLIRDRLLAGTFGASIDLDIYYAAFRLPDLIYSIIFAGGIIVAFLPIFSEYQKKDKSEAWKISNYLINLFGIVYFVFFIIFLFFSPDFINTLIGKFSFEHQAKAIALTRLIFVAVFFFGISSIFSTILNYFQRFLVYSLAPIFYNLGIILGTIFLSPYYGIFGPGIGVVAGAIMHFLIQVPSAINCGYRYQAILKLNHPAIHNFFKLVVPRIIASSSSQINFLVATFIASGIGIGAISVFNLSYNLSFLPIGILGVSFATAVFPALSKLWVENNKSDFYLRFRESFLQVLYFAFPIGLMVFILRNQIVQIIYQTGKFDETAVAITAAALGVYVLSLATQCLVPILLRGFFSIKDTVTPTIIAIFYMILNIILFFPFVALFGGGNVFLLDFFGREIVLSLPAWLNANNIFVAIIKQAFDVDGLVNFPLLGLVLVFNLCSLLEFALLFIFLYKKTGDFGLKQIRESFSKIFLATIIMGFAGFGSLAIVTRLFENTFWGSIWQFIVVCVISTAVYLGATFIIKCPEVNFVISYFQKIKSRFAIQPNQVNSQQNK
jgi:putative peptidoglycan lipid II flippase